MGEASTEREDVLAWKALCQLLPEKALVERVQRLAALKLDLDRRAATVLKLAIRHANAFVEAPTPPAPVQPVA